MGIRLKRGSLGELLVLYREENDGSCRVAIDGAVERHGKGEKFGHFSSSLSESKRSGD